MFDPQATVSLAPASAIQTKTHFSTHLLQLQPYGALMVTLLLAFGAGRAASMNRNVKPVGSEPFGHRQPLGPSRQMQIKNTLASVAIEMAVLGHIRAKMRRSPIESHLPD